ncbi:MAG: hypothetical protein K5925_01435 [Bacilli bacterium]|nr:hypothetical protein [Bacilli bacterium]
MGDKLGRKKSLIKIVAATSVVIFSLLSVCAGAFAWFLSERDQSAASSSFSVKSYGKFESISFHRLTSKNVNVANDSTSTFSFEKTAYGAITYNWDTGKYIPSGTSTSLTLPQYDPLDQHQPVLAVIKLNREYDTDGGSVVIKTTTTVDGFLGKQNETTHVNIYKLGNPSDPTEAAKPTLKMTNDYDDGVHDRYPLSSVANMRCQNFSTTEYTTWANGSTLDLTLGNLTGKKSFVTVDNALGTSSFTKSIEVYNSGEGKDIQYIAVMIDYDPDAIEYTYSTYLGNDIMESYNYILYFLCDWEWEIF